MLSSDNHPTRLRSIEAAIAVVRERGLPELTTRAVAQESGFTQPAIYRHFATKDDLVSEVLGEIRRSVFVRLEESGSDPDPRQRLMSAMLVFRDFAIDEPRLYDALFLQTAEGLPAPPPVNPAEGGNIFGVLVSRVSESAAAGGVRSAGPVAIALSLAAHAQGLVLLYRQGRFGGAERFAQFYETSVGDLLVGLSRAAT
jgi:AcrR family transcriptional regulator